MKPFALLSSALIAPALAGALALPALAHEPAAPPDPVRFRAPVEAPMNSPYGDRMHAVLKKLVAHHGLDYASAKGDAVRAAAAGKVLYVGWYGGYGKVVMIDHGQDLVSLVAHLDGASVKAGQQVRRGDRIATAGATGMAPQPKTHFEVRRHGAAIDPTGLMARE